MKHSGIWLSASTLALLMIKAIHRNTYIFIEARFKQLVHITIWRVIRLTVTSFRIFLRYNDILFSHCYLIYSNLAISGSKDLRFSSIENPVKWNLIFDLINLLKFIGNDWLWNSFLLGSDLCALAREINFHIYCNWNSIRPVLKNCCRKVESNVCAFFFALERPQFLTATLLLMYINTKTL